MPAAGAMEHGGGINWPTGRGGADRGAATVARVINAAGSAADLARQIGVTRQLVSRWHGRGRVPAEWLPAVARATGLSAAEIRPDLFVDAGDGAVRLRLDDGDIHDNGAEPTPTRIAVTPAVAALLAVMAAAEGCDAGAIVETALIGRARDRHGLRLGAVADG